MQPDWLPEFFCREDYGNDLEKYIEALYQIFTADFIDSKPTINGRDVASKKGLIDGKSDTFWHLVSSGEGSNRKTDSRRCKRIRWPRAIIDHSEEEQIKVWRNKRGSSKRICIFFDLHDYIIILADRKGYYLLITAYLVTKKKRKKKFLEEYEAYKKADAVSQSDDGTDTPSTHGS